MESFFTLTIKEMNSNSAPWKDSKDVCDRKYICDKLKLRKVLKDMLAHAYLKTNNLSIEAHGICNLNTALESYSLLIMEASLLHVR